MELRSAVSWDGTFHAVDFLQNLLLYAPLGAALSSRSWRLVVSSAAALSIAAEVVQLWSFERFSSPYDVLSNVLGACAGMWLWRRYRRKRDGAHVVLGASAIAACVLASALTFAVWKVPRQASEIAGWDSSFRVLLGNESTGDRPWRGTIHAMRILAGALSPQQVSVLGEKPLDVEDRELRASTLYRSSEVMDFEGGRAIALPHSLSSDLAKNISSFGAFTLLLRVEPANTSQAGPARIVSFSRDTEHRNFDLGQEQGRLIMRVRTPVSGLNGQNFHAETLPVLNPRTEVFVVATYDGRVSRIFVNGELYGRSDLAAAGCFVSTICGSGLPLVWSFFGATLAIVVFALMPGSESGSRIGLATAASAFAAVGLPHLPYLFPDWAVSPAWVKAMPPFGALAVGTAAAIGSRVRAEHDGLRSSGHAEPSTPRQ